MAGERNPQAFVGLVSPEERQMVLDKLRSARQSIISAGDKVPLRMMPGPVGLGGRLIDEARKQSQDRSVVDTAPLPDVAPSTLGDVANLALSKPGAEVAAGVASPLADITLTGRDLKESFGRATRGEATGWDYATGALAPLSLLPFVPAPSTLKRSMAAVRGGEELEELPARALPEYGGGRFYSPVEQAILQSKRGEGLPSEWLAELRKAPGVKVAELEDRGIREALEKQAASERQMDLFTGKPKPLTKRDIYSQVRESPVSELEATDIGGSVKKAYAEVPELDLDGNRARGYSELDVEGLDENGVSDAVYERASEEWTNRVEEKLSELEDEWKDRYSVDEVDNDEGEMVWQVSDEDGEVLDTFEDESSADLHVEELARDSARDYIDTEYGDRERERYIERFMENSNYGVHGEGDESRFASNPDIEETWGEKTLGGADDYRVRPLQFKTAGQLPKAMEQKLLEQSAQRLWTQNEREMLRRLTNNEDIFDTDITVNTTDWADLPPEERQRRIADIRSQGALEDLSAAERSALLGYSRSAHFGLPNELFYTRLSDVRDAETGEGALFIHEAQSDLAKKVRRGEAAEPPLMKNWDRLAFNDALSEAVADSRYSALSWPATAEQVAAVEGWSTIREDYKPIIERMTESFPKQARNFGKRFGVQPQKKLMTMADGSKQEVWTLPITEKMREAVTEEGLPLYAFKGGKKDLAKMTADKLRSEVKGAAIGAVRDEVREQNEKSKRRSESLRRPAEERTP